MDPQTNSFRDRLEQKLNDRKAHNLFRERQTLSARQGAKVKIDGRDVINFCSNDYLGLSNHPDIVAAFKAVADQFGVGSGSSSLVSGRYRLHQQLEEKLAEKTGREAALLFPSGYMANLAIATSLAGRGDAIFLDRLAHASMIDAARLSGAKLHRYQHADPESLALGLSKSTSKIKLVLTDAVFSMDGDKAPMRELAAICEQHQAVLVVDDAHGFGVLGEQGGGLLEETGLRSDQAPVLMATFGKALGTAGAFVAADKCIIESLVQFGRSYIYTTAAPPALAAATLAALEIVDKESWRRKELIARIKHFRLRAKEQDLKLLASETAIQPLIVGDSASAVQLSQALLKEGFLNTAIRPPTVPEGSARLRITLTAEHTNDQIDQLLETLGKLL